ncbi:hypothetical protein ASD45_00145 [Pseudolabrys sp. Root1462]|uniref:hypothetical protein n=1 Tax=Pseudolabrys sp. Root1462 TaxID=1736466 RepID=UPI000702C1DE|nr:hypothetical protein [Pseudolabrys sp. Root1462]KQY99383.1 hypothetical protein ASD45_00145 [Pseudolabrys sp. Root1462]
MAIPGYDIYINDVPRTFRDVKEIAIEAATFLKMRNLSSTVEIVERETGMTAEIKDINRPPVWEKPRARDLRKPDLLQFLLSTSRMSLNLIIGRFFSSITVHVMAGVRCVTWSAAASAR